MPGCPFPTFCTASIARTRTRSTARLSAGSSQGRGCSPLVTDPFCMTSLASAAAGGKLECAAERGQAKSPVATMPRMRAYPVPIAAERAGGDRFHKVHPYRWSRPLEATGLDQSDGICPHARRRSGPAQYASAHDRAQPRPSAEPFDPRAVLAGRVPGPDAGRVHRRHRDHRGLRDRRARHRRGAVVRGRRRRRAVRDRAAAGAAAGAAARRAGAVDGPAGTRAARPTWCSRSPGAPGSRRWPR